MSTPCILAVGTPTSWRGVPCKMEGSPESTGPVIIDRVVRLGGVAAAAKALVTDAPFGWGCAGGEALDEVDECLVGDDPGGTLSHRTEAEIFHRHYAIFLLDPEASSLCVKILPEDAWRKPTRFTASALGSQDARVDDRRRQKAIATATSTMAAAADADFRRRTSAPCTIPSMLCPTCGAPLSDAMVAAGACRFCETAIAAPSLDGAVANLLSAVASQAQAGAVNIQATTIVIEGKTYRSLAEIPPDVRARNAEKIAKVERLGLLR